MLSMAHQSLAVAATVGAAPPADGDDVVIVKSRYGDYEVRRDHLITFPKGLIGFGDQRRFALLDLPNPGADRFKLLQSLDDLALAFHVLPLQPETSGFDSADIAAAVGPLDIKSESLAVLLIVTLRRADDGVELTANMRAPVLIDANSRTAYQHVIANEKYSLRQRLN